MRENRFFFFISLIALILFGLVYTPLLNSYLKTPGGASALLNGNTSISVGSAEISTYSPKVADFISDKEHLKAVVRECLRPFIWTLKKIIK